MSTEANKRTIIQWFDTVNTKDLDAISRIADQTYTPDCVFRDVMTISGTGPEYVKQFLNGFFSYSPEAHIEVGDVITEGDKAACRYTVHGNNQATGKPETIEVMYIARFSGEKIGEIWQIGVPIPTVVDA
jgi:ketosteroid isomerase-like protein